MLYTSAEATRGEAKIVGFALAVQLPRLVLVGPERANILKNPSFEEGRRPPLPGWGFYGEGYKVDKRGRRGRCILVEAERTGRFGARYVLELNQREPVPLVVGAWSRAERARPRWPSCYSVYVDIIYADGTPLWGQVAPFSPGTHNWERAEVVIVPEKPIKVAYIHLLFRNATGKVWFDDAYAFELRAGEGCGVFDLLPVKAEGATIPPGDIINVEAGEGFALKFDTETGRVFSACWLEACLPAESPFLTGFLARDVKSGSPILPLWGRLEKEPEGLRLRGKSEELGIRLSATLRELPLCLRVDAEVENVRPEEERALTIYFALPFPRGKETLWWDDPRRSREAKSGVYQNTFPIPAGANGTMSRYPLGCVSSSNLGLAVGIPMDCPRLFRIAYSADFGLLYIAFDLALTKHTKKFPNRATLSFVVYNFDPRWGMRAALDRYYRIFPQFFTKRLEREGIWMPFGDISKVEGFEDFGFAFHELGSNIEFDEEHGIYSFRYIEPSSHHMPIDPSLPRTEEVVTRALEERIREGRGRAKFLAVSTLTCGAHGPDGKLFYVVERAPWCDGVLFCLNPDPDIPPTPDLPFTKAMELDLKWLENFVAEGGDGIYLDSLEMFGTALNFRKDHFKFVDLPLVYDREKRRPCILHIFSVYEFAKHVAEELRKRGKFLMANGAALRFGFLCHLLDVGGTETKWLRGEKFLPMSDRDMLYKRAMMGRKPYLLLLNVDFDLFPPELVERYMRYCVAYAFYPSMFSPKASTKHKYYWGNPGWYNRDRHLFRKYVPVVRRLSGAGWEPLTYATVHPEEGIVLERYGSAERGEVYFAVLNRGGEEREVHVEVDARALSLPQEGLEAEDIVSGRVVKLLRSSGKLAFSLRLRPDEVAVVKVYKASQ